MKIISPSLETARLILRAWTQADIDEYYNINQDPKVIEFLKGSLSIEEIRDFITCMNHQLHDRGYTLWATEEKLSGKLLGFIGLNYINWVSSFTPAVEVGWRLGSEHWNKGYATEGAKACVAYGFHTCRLQEIISFTVPANARSIRVMEKIDMLRDINGDFAHPKLSSDHKLSRHVLYRISNNEVNEY